MRHTSVDIDVLQWLASLAWQRFSLVTALERAQTHKSAPRQQRSLPATLTSAFRKRFDE